MATRLALAFGLTCVRLYLNEVNHSLGLVTTPSYSHRPADSCYFDDSASRQRGGE